MLSSFCRILFTEGNTPTLPKIGKNIQVPKIHRAQPVLGKMSISVSSRRHQSRLGTSIRSRFCDVLTLVNISERSSIQHLWLSNKSCTVKGATYRLEPPFAQA